jgi:hypothetical protein
MNSWGRSHTLSFIIVPQSLFVSQELLQIVVRGKLDLISEIPVLSLNLSGPSVSHLASMLSSKESSGPLLNNRGSFGMKFKFLTLQSLHLAFYADNPGDSGNFGFLLCGIVTMDLIQNLSSLNSSYHLRLAGLNICKRVVKLGWLSLGHLVLVVLLDALEC